ncbi:lipoic acid synthetase [Geobacter argillaceus]|uniref:Lipoyl synthase n=2 Tax=Geobacter argillaceus TaxID=345631 RepID=A0A562WSA5_9BACT|nr:lipoic acid synthetase [Geobacter argillaceus]
MEIRRKPSWLQKKVSPAANADMERLLAGLSLHTVCQEASCPNISECFRQRQATFLILGAICTRHCTFCNVGKASPLPADPQEPGRVADAVQRLALAHVVVTSPTRDDLADGGANHYAATVAAIRRSAPETAIELLIPDLQGDRKALETIQHAGPNILGHNLETVPRLYHIRAGADYNRSLELLRMAREIAPEIPTKSGVMLGLGETEEELLAVLTDLRGVGCAYVSIGQYLAPSRRHQPVVEFVPPERFEQLKAAAEGLGFAHVESGPYVRSSYHADRYHAADART